MKNNQYLTLALLVGVFALTSCTVTQSEVIDGNSKTTTMSFNPDVSTIMQRYAVPVVNAGK